MSSGAVSGLRTEPVFSCPATVFNEVYGADGAPRAHWQKFLNAYRTVAPTEFARRNAQADRMLRENGVNYHSVTDGGEGARPWRLDLLPMLTTSAEWSSLEIALGQRARLLNLLISDIYGPRRLVEEGLLPPEVLYANPEFLRPFCDLRRPDVSSMFLYAAELARSANGSWCVMADRSEAPAGPVIECFTTFRCCWRCPRTHRSGKVEARGCSRIVRRLWKACQRPGFRIKCETGVSTSGL